jgi:myo-inositol 2-dehydrogenase/D-chiro-inositol 1-dehydrogenase
MQVKIGIIGCGHMGHVHGKILKQDKRVELPVVCDKDEARARDLAQILGTTHTTTVQEVYKIGVDAVYICTPNTMHVDLVIEALERGVHVFSEKPMATSLDGAQKILAKSRNSKALYNLGFNRRFAPAYKKAKEVVSQSSFRASSAHIKMNRGELKNPAWVSNKAVTGGFLYESTIHLLDMTRFLLGEVKTIHCLGKKSVYDDFDDFAMTFEFVDGKVATFMSCAHASWIFPFERIEIYGDHCAVVTEEMEKIHFTLGLQQEMVTHDFFQLSNEVKWGYIEEDRRFVDAVLGKADVPVSGSEGFKATQLVELCYEAAHSGNPVVVPSR